MFQFTHPGKGATTAHHSIEPWRAVSIHAPWEGCDRFTCVASIPSGKFQFTHPGKGATQTESADSRALGVSIHAPWEGCDRNRIIIGSNCTTFQFTHPGKGATIPQRRGRERGRFQFTHPGKGATSTNVSGISSIVSFNSRTLGRVRQCGAKLRIIGRINKRNLRLGVLS